MTRLAPVVLLAALLSGCSMAPHYVRPAMPVPRSWPVGDAYLRQSEATVPIVRFETIFTDPRLQALVTQALANNRDLRVAAANVLAARARVDVQRAAQLPEVGVSAGVTRRSGSGSGATGDSSVRTTYSVSGGVSAFELDLFGRLASATAAERNTALAIEAAARTVRLALVADLANAWAAHAADTELLRVAQLTASSATRTVTLTRARLQGGVAPRSDVRQAEQVLATAQADVATQTAAVAQDRNAIELLVGAPVADNLLPAELGSVIGGIKPLAAGQSSEVLLRRPDVVEAEYRLRAANADVGVARAELFPRISLTGLLGLASDALGGLFRAGAFSTTLGANANYAVFAGGGARAGVRVSEAQLQAAVATYERTVQVAFREVADALARQGTIGSELAAVNLQAEAAEDTARLVEARYRGGVASSLENLDAQRSAYAAQRRLVTTRQAYVNNRIELYRVLGGDPTTAAPAP